MVIASVGANGKLLSSNTNVRFVGTCTPKRSKTQTVYIQKIDTYYKIEDAEEERRR